LVAWRFFTRILGVASTLVMARILVPADFGLLAMATTFAAAIDAFSQLGLQEALIRRTEDDERLHDTAFTLQVGRAVVNGAAIAITASLASDWFGDARLTPILWVLAALSIVSGGRNIGIVAFRRDMDYRRQFLFLCAPRLIQVVVTIPVALWLQSYWALVLGIVVSKMVELVISYGIHPYRPRFSLKGWRELAAFSLWTWLASLASVVWNRCDPFVIGPVVGTAQLGLYLLASEIAMLPISELVAPATEALFSGFALAQKQGTSPITSAMSVATALLLVVMPLIIAVSCTGGYIVAAALGPGWSAAQQPVEIAAWLGLFAPYSFVCGAALVAANRVRSSCAVNCLTSLVKLGGLAVVVSITTDLAGITAAVVLIVGAESSIFIAALARAGDARIGESAGGLLRIIISTVITVSVLVATGFAWRPVVMPAWQALLIGAPLGCFAMVTFIAASLLVWRIAGRPEGPETQAGNLIRHVAGPLAAKLTRARAMTAAAKQ
jgi:lipopolysaccharide exporter